ncbi:MAG: Flp pilus assembly complex ATPase component TadA [Elusimicrobia bacterium]|nr:Flp pilus assembly complex ATPase component TadA [Elusimicrobiota bacterium]
MMKSELSEALLEAGILDEEKYKQVQSECKKSGKDIISALVDLQFASKEQILQLLSREWNVRMVELSQIEVDPEVGKILPKELAKKKMMIPFGKQNGKILLAMQDPRDLFAVEDVEMRFGFQVVPHVALAGDIKATISKVYGEKAATEEAVEEEEKEVPKETQISQEEFAENAQELTQELMGSLKEADASELEVGKAEEVEDIMQVDTSAPEVEKIVNAVILEAIRLKASDIHVEPFEKKLMVRYRVDGALRRSSFKIPFIFRNALIAKIKIMSSMNITERRIPQDGRIAIKVRGKPYEFRVNIVPTVMGESAVLRILDRSGANLTLDQLGFLTDTKDRFLDALSKPYGLILVCGPTGSGKSFTLMAALAAVRDPEDKILTAENPVEYNLEGVVQVQVNPDLSLGEGRKFDFSAALRAFLRQDPDTIMVGEIRDEETGHIACEAAMTGHLVLSTIHTNDATSVIGRLAEMGVPPYLIASTLECVLAQRLIRTLCSKCKEPETHPSEEMLQTLDQEGVDYKKASFMKIKGCDKCGKRGMKGRTAIHELLIMNDAIKGICKPGVKNDDVREVAIKSGMRTLMQDGLAKVAMGLTTYEEILSAAK